MADWRILGRLTDASNVTLLVESGGRRHVYKPVRGERRLWDFPDGTLARREVAAYEVSRRLGWQVIPPTRWVDDAPMGPGSIQEWVEHSGDAVAVFPAGRVPGDWLPVLEAVDGNDTPLVVAHADTPALRRLALFDLVVNNTDRKGGHVLSPRAGAVAGIDNGLCFHAEPKVRTVLWGFAGQPVADDLLSDLRMARDDLPDLLSGLDDDEKSALVERIDEIVLSKTFPHPAGGPVIPWPPI